eukprot:4711838-Amphidinium_carterae.1
MLDATEYQHQGPGGNLPCLHTLKLPWLQLHNTIVFWTLTTVLAALRAEVNHVSTAWRHAVSGGIRRLLGEALLKLVGSPGRQCEEGYKRLWYPAATVHSKHPLRIAPFGQA